LVHDYRVQEEYMDSTNATLQDCRTCVVVPAVDYCIVCSKNKVRGCQMHEAERKVSKEKNNFIAKYWQDLQDITTP